MILSVFEEGRDVASAVKDRDDLQWDVRIPIDNQVGSNPPEAHRAIREVATGVALARPARQLCEGREKIVDLPIGCGWTVGGYKVPDTLKIAEGLRRDYEAGHCGYLVRLRRNCARA